MDSFTAQMLEILAIVAVGGGAAFAVVVWTLRTTKNPRHRRG